MDTSNKEFENNQASEDGKTSNVGAGPVKSVADGGTEGEAKQPKEHTGKSTHMGGATGGTSGLPDASEGNDNTGSAS